jgi:uncharacterized small protein (DUF1192 family)
VQARYNIRRSRRKGEEVHDEVEDLISLEVEELQKGVAAIQLELDATRATLAEVSACTPPACCVLRTSH